MPEPYFDCITILFSIAMLFFLSVLIDFSKREERGETEKHPCKGETSMGYLLYLPNQGLNLNLSVCPDWESNWLPFGARDDAQSTETHQPGLPYFS